MKLTNYTNKKNTVFSFSTMKFLVIIIALLFIFQTSFTLAVNNHIINDNIINQDKNKGSKESSQIHNVLRENKKFSEDDLSKVHLDVQKELVDTYESGSDDLIRVIIDEKNYLDENYSGIVGFFEEGVDKVKQNMATSRINKKVKKKGSFVQNTKHVKAVFVTPDGLGDLIEDNAITAIYPDQKNFPSLIETTIMTGAENLYASNYLGTNVTIAIIDSGIEESHDIFGGRVILNKSFVPSNGTNDISGHGTHVASLAAGGQFEMIQSGMAPNASIINARVVRDTNFAYTSDIIAAIEWVVDPDGNPATDDGADIISLSLGGAYKTIIPPYRDAILSAINQGVIVVAAAGNCGVSNPSPDPSCGNFTGVIVPGRIHDVITVGAMDKSNAYPVFSSYEWIKGEGIKPDLVAPGVNILGAVPGNTVGYKTGTSMATPIVSGGIALLLDKDPSLNQEEVKTLLQISANDYGTSGNDYYYGFGALNVSRAMDILDTYTPRTLTLGVGKNLIGFSSNALVDEDLLSNNLANQMGIGMYNASSQSVNKWSYHIPQFFIGHPQNTLTTVSFENGYQVNLFKNDTFVYYEQTVNSADYNLKKGWNLISYPFIDAKSIADFFGSQLSSIEAVYTFINDTEYAWYDPSYSLTNNLSILKPGHGYWVNAGEDVLLSVTN